MASQTPYTAEKGKARGQVFYTHFQSISQHTPAPDTIPGDVSQYFSISESVPMKLSSSIIFKHNKIFQEKKIFSTNKKNHKYKCNQLNKHQINKVNCSGSFKKPLLLSIHIAITYF